MAEPSYLLVESLISGVDRTRPRYAQQAGTIWSGINGHITRGGDFEKRKAFVATHLLPAAATVGLAKQATGLTVFGHAAAPGGMPAGVTYQRLEHGANVLEQVNSWTLFNGKIYAIASYDNDDVRHFYDGAMVTDWNSGGTTPVGYGSIAFTFQRKIYSPIVSLLWACQLDTPTNWDTAASGSFFENMANHISGSDSVTALGTFQQQLAIFSRRFVQIWSMVADPLNNAPTAYLPETGTIAHRSVLGYGETDAFYLSDSGIRSLRARTGTNIPGVNDVGTPIDTLIREHIADLTEAQIARAIALVEPEDGRFWMFVGSRIYVFSYFPSKKVSAWTWFEPGLTFTDAVTFGARTYARSGDTIYTYGGAAGLTYDASRVTLALPYLYAGKPGTFKQLRAMDVAAQGAWQCKVLIDPNDETQEVNIGELTKVTFHEEAAPAVGHTTHMAPVLTNQDLGPASLSMLALYFDSAETD